MEDKINLKEIANKDVKEIMEFLKQNPTLENDMLQTLKQNAKTKSKFFTISALLKDAKHSNSGIGALVVNNSGYTEVQVDDLLENPYQPRIEMNDEDIRELANSIKADGLQSPIKVSPKENKYIIVFGHRRVAAHKLLGKQKIKCIIEDTSDAQLRRLGLLENIQRVDLSLIEKAIAYKHFLEEEGLTQKELASQINISESKISETLSILKLDERIINDLKTFKEIRDVQIFSLLSQINQEEQFEIYLKIKDGIIDREKLKELVKNQKPSPKKDIEINIRGGKMSLSFKTKIKQAQKKKDFMRYMKEKTDALVEDLKSKEKELLEY